MRVYELDRSGGVLHKAVAALRAEEPARTGLHVSTIVEDFCSCLPQAPKYGGFSLTQRFAFQEMGNIFEELLASALRQRLGWEKPEPRADRDGIIGSPDGYSARARRIDEVKVTWVSEHNFVEISDDGIVLSNAWKWDRYVTQALKYADEDLFPADRIGLHVLFVCGNYRPPFPNFRSWTIRVTPDERRAHATLLRQHAIDRGLLKGGRRAPRH